MIKQIQRHKIDQNLKNLEKNQFFSLNSSHNKILRKSF